MANKDTNEFEFDYDLERMHEMVENQMLVEVPKNLDTLEKCDDWLDSINDNS